MYIFNRVTVVPKLPSRVGRLPEIANNLWWSWNTEFLRLFQEIDPNLSFHDFRIVAGHTHQNILFDVVIPRNYRYTDKDLAKVLKEKIKSDKNYNFIITTDFNYFINQEN